MKEKEEYQKRIKNLLDKNKHLFIGEKIPLKIKVGIRIFDVSPKLFYVINDYIHLIY